MGAACPAALNVQAASCSGRTSWLAPPPQLSGSVARGRRLRPLAAAANGPNVGTNRLDSTAVAATASAAPGRATPPGSGGGGVPPPPPGGLLINSGAAAAGSSSSSAGGAAGSRSEEWLDLLQTPEPDMFGPRARSASDAAVLRRKGHLKEQDKFIQFVLDMHQTHTSLEVMQKMERWIAEHRKDPRTSRLRRMVPTIGSFFLPLKCAPR